MKTWSAKKIVSESPKKSTRDDYKAKVEIGIGKTGALPSTLAHQEAKRGGKQDDGGLAFCRKIQKPPSNLTHGEE